MVMIAALSSTSSLRGVMPGTPASGASFRSSMSVAQTVAPSRAKARAVAAPMPCPAAVTKQFLPFSLIDPALLDQALLAIELLGPRMQRDPHALERRLEPDVAALGVARIEQLARARIPQRRRDLVDQLVGLLARGHPERMHADRLHAGDALVGAVGNLVDAEEIVLLDQLLRARALDRDELDADGRGELGDRTLRPAGNAEERVDLAVLQAVGDALRRQVLGLEILLLEAERRQDQPRVDQRTGARLVERHALAAQVGHRLDAGPGAHHQVDALRVEIADRPKRVDLGPALIDAGAGVGPIGDVGLHESRLRRTGSDRGRVGDRPV